MKRRRDKKSGGSVATGGWQDENDALIDDRQKTALGLNEARPFFDEAWYAAGHGLADGSIEDFIARGQFEGESPNPFIDTEWYRERNPDIAETGWTPIAHYVIRGARERRNPGPFFDANWYRAQVDGLGIEPQEYLPHYVSEGWRSGLSPSPYFTPDWYQARYLGQSDGSTDPLVHFIDSGSKDGLDPSPYFDTAWYIAQVSELPVEVKPLLHYLSQGWLMGISPSPYFDVVWYLDQNPDVKEASTEPLAHYIAHGRGEGRSPNAVFDGNWYLSTYPDVAAAGREPLRHYIEAGGLEGRDPAPTFDSRWYRSHYLDDDPAQEPLRHYLSIGHVADLPTQSATPDGSAPAPIHVDAASQEVVEAYVGQVLRAPVGGSDEYVPYRAVSDPSHGVQVVAFYLPQFHPIPENDEWWGPGFTEWTNVAKSVPQFVGHYQPRLPADLGYYDLRVADVQRKQVEIAKNYGITGFAFHYYWFGGRRVLEGPIDAFHADRSLDLKYCISWANENWTRRWDGDERHVLLEQSKSTDVNAQFASSIIEYIRDDRYIRVAGKPLVIVYRPSLLGDAKGVVARWRQEFHSAGVGDVLLACAQFDVLDPRPYGFDAAVEFPPHKVGRDLPSMRDETQFVNATFSGDVIAYDDVAKVARDLTRAAGGPDQDGYELFHGVMPAWDNSARRVGAGTVYHGSTPESYRAWVVDAARASLRRPVAGESVIFVNAWNEWAEGAYLEPDRRYGYAYLDATEVALAEVDRTGTTPPKRILLVVHDAHNHGAQQNALSMARTLIESYDISLDVLLLKGGKLEDQFRQLGRVHMPEVDGRSLQSIVKELRDQGCDVSLCNTAATGGVIPELQQSGMRVVSLVHEMPGLLSLHGLGVEAANTSELSDRVIFASQLVRQAFESSFGEVGARGAIRPQGLYHLPARWTASPEDAERAKRELGIPSDADVVLAAGFADLRKGIDVFMRVFEECRRQDENAFFIWLGCEDSEQVEWYTRDAERLGYSQSLRLLPRVPDVGKYFEAASVLALPSREDPYPSVVLEALSQGVPVVAFDGATGSNELLERGCGLTVPYLDASEMAHAILSITRDAELRERLGTRGRSLVREEHDWRDYVGYLLDECGYPRPTVSVIVPNYNYRPYLRQRLETIKQQTYPIGELIVLDDASTDGSVDEVRRLEEELDLPVVLVENAENSGNVFRQWARGAEMASGDLVWIAEADDFAEPAFLSRLVPMFNQESVVLAYTESRQVDSQGRVLSENFRDYTRDLGPSRWLTASTRVGTDELADTLCVKNTIPNASAVLFRAETLKLVLGTEMDWISSYQIAGDWAVYAALLELGDLAFVPESLNSNRRHEDGVTIGSFGPRVYGEIERMQRDIGSRFRISATGRERATAYLRELRAQFDL